MCATGHNSGDGHNHDSSGGYSEQTPRAVQRNIEYNSVDENPGYLMVKYR